MKVITTRCGTDFPDLLRQNSRARPFLRTPLSAFDLVLTLTIAYLRMSEWSRWAEADTRAYRRVVTFFAGSVVFK